MFATLPVCRFAGLLLFLEMSINWHTKSQGLKKKCISFSKGRINPWPICCLFSSCLFSSFTVLD